MSSSDAALEAVRESREKLETLAESELPAAWIAEGLLDAVDDEDGNTEGSA